MTIKAVYPALLSDRTWPPSRVPPQGTLSGASSSKVRHRRRPQPGASPIAGLLPAASGAIRALIFPLKLRTTAGVLPDRPALPPSIKVLSSGDGTEP